MLRAKSRREDRHTRLVSLLHYVVVGLVLLSLASRAGLAQTANQVEDGSEQQIALVGGTLIDGRGGTPIENAIVLIKGNRIVKLGNKRDVKYPKTVTMIDATGKYILPGLIDLHVHYFDWMGELFLAHGVTTIKDLGNDVEWMSTISSEVQQGQMRGPRIFYVGNGLDSPPPARVHYVGVTSPAMARRAVDLLKSRGVSAIKVREKITPDALAAITDEAHKFNLPVTAHLRSIDAREAALAGVNGLEHVTGVTQAIANYPRQVPPDQPELQVLISDLKAFSLIDPVKGEELIRFLASKHVALIPTMANWWRMASDRRDDFARADAEYAKNPLLAYVPDDIRKLWTTSFVYHLKSADDLAQMQSGYKKLQLMLMQHYKAGGKVLAGSDTFLSVPGLSLQRELLLLVDAGFTPMQAIVIATRDNAQFLGKSDELGTIGVGKLADIVVVNANPLADIRNTQQISMVIKDGKVVDTTYHPDYSIPTPKPKLEHPTWIERQLQNTATTKSAAARY